jgi:hypothetical protein
LLFRAEEIGVSMGTGLSRIRHRNDSYIDKKSRLSEKMVDWWISSTWINPESDDDDDDDNDDDDNNNDDPNNNDHDNNNNDNDDNNPSSTATIIVST